MADNAILFKFLAKSVGMKHGITPSFMAKPWANVSSLLEPFSACFDLVYPSSQVVAGEFAVLHLFYFAHLLPPDTSMCP